MSILKPAFGDASPNFIGTIGQTLSPGDFAAANYLIDENRYDYEGNWAFCRFTSEEVPAARFGFGRGKLDLTDYGLKVPASKSFLWLHIELMTAEGALLWLCTEKFKAEEVMMKPDIMDMRLPCAGREIFCIRGWPQMKWRFESDDSEVEVDMQLEIMNVTILPDCIMPRNFFSMWLAVCSAQGELAFKNRKVKVSGTAFYDHPRINVQNSSVPPFGWYLYTPMRFSDGSCLACYYTQDGRKRPVDYYCFGIYLDANGKAVWLGETKLTGIDFDGDGKPKTWNMNCQGKGLNLNVHANVRDASILKAWGGSSAPQTRKENGNIPLVFDCEAELKTGEGSKKTSGGGLAEYVARAKPNV